MIDLLSHPKAVGVIAIAVASFLSGALYKTVLLSTIKDEEAERIVKRVGIISVVVFSIVMVLLTQIMHSKQVGYLFGNMATTLVTFAGVFGWGFFFGTWFLETIFRWLAKKHR